MKRPFQINTPYGAVCIMAESKEKALNTVGKLYGIYDWPIKEIPQGER